MSRDVSLAELAERFSARLAGDGQGRIRRVADLSGAEPGAITFMVNPRFKALLAQTRASAVILAEHNLPACPAPALVSDQPDVLFARVADFLHPDEDLLKPPGAHPSASVAGSAVVHESAIIEANAVIEDAVTVGAGAFIGPGTVIRKGASVGAGSKLTANVTVCHDCCLGRRVLVHPGAVIGSDGFGLAHDGSRWIKVPQLGRVVIGDDVEIGSGVAIDRGALRDTVIENGVKLDNQIHIAHNVRIGENTAMAAQSAIAGSTTIGRDCAIGGKAGIVGHLEIADRTHLNAFSDVTHSIKEPGGSYASGAPLEPTPKWRRNWVRFKQLDDMARRLKALAKRLESRDTD